MDQQQRLEKEAVKKEAKAEAKADADAKKRQVRQSTGVNVTLHYSNTRLLCHRRLRYSISPRISSRFVICVGPLPDNNQENRPKQKQARHCRPWVGTVWWVLLRLSRDGRLDNPPTLFWPRTLVGLDSALTSLPTGIDLKKAAKQFAQKFATGASVTKNAQGFDEVVVQGDVSEEIQELLEGQVGVLKGIDADKIVRVEEKTKKKGGAAAAGGED